MGSVLPGQVAMPASPFTVNSIVRYRGFLSVQIASPATVSVSPPKLSTMASQPSSRRWFWSTESYGPESFTHVSLYVPVE